MFKFDSKKQQAAAAERLEKIFNRPEIKSILDAAEQQEDSAALEARNAVLDQISLAELEAAKAEAEDQRLLEVVTRAMDQLNEAQSSHYAARQTAITSRHCVSQLLRSLAVEHGESAINTGLSRLESRKHALEHEIASLNSSTRTIMGSLNGFPAYVPDPNQQNLLRHASESLKKVGAAMERMKLLQRTRMSPKAIADEVVGILRWVGIEEDQEIDLEVFYEASRRRKDKPNGLN